MNAGHRQPPVDGRRDVGRDDVLGVTGLQRAAVEHGGLAAVRDAQAGAAGQLGGDRNDNETDQHSQHDQTTPIPAKTMDERRMDSSASSDSEHHTLPYRGSAGIIRVGDFRGSYGGLRGFQDPIARGWRARMSSS